MARKGRPTKREQKLRALAEQSKTTLALALSKMGVDGETISRVTTWPIVKIQQLLRKENTP